MKRTKWIAFLCFAFLMAGLGANDALRGIFAPVFQERYDLNGSQLSLIVTISYVGNLLFLSIGGKLLDLFPRKNVAVAVTAVWAGAVALNLVSDSYIWILVSMFFALGASTLLNTLFPRKNVAVAVTAVWAGAVALNLVSDSYIWILVSMFFALGASTLLNTTVNILTPAVFAGYAGLMVNVLFFIQGIGTSGSQLLLGRYAFHYAGWKWINAALLAVAFLVIVLFFFLKIPKQGEEKEQEKEIFKKEPDSKIFWIFIAMMGCYFIGEHGIMNWLMSYCISAFSMEASSASASLSLFWGGMTAGRLMFAPVVQKMGAVKSMKLFGGIGTVMFCAGCILGESGVWWGGMTAGRLMFAPVVQKMGAVKSMKLFGGIGTVMFCAGCILGESGVWVLGASGFALAILYPTMVLLIQQIYPVQTAATRTGVIISAATVADIVFNLLFGAVSSKWGYGSSFMILPVAMAVFYGLYLRLARSLKRN